MKLKTLSYGRVFLIFNDKIDELNEVSCFSFASLAVNIAYSADINPSIQKYWSIAEQQNLDQDITWQRLMYANKTRKVRSLTVAISYQKWKNNLKEELKADISALFMPAQDNQSIRCKFLRVANGSCKSRHSRK